MDEIQTNILSPPPNPVELQKEEALITSPVDKIFLPKMNLGRKFMKTILNHEKHCRSIKAPREETKKIIRNLCFSIWCHVVSSSTHIFICNSLPGCCFSTATSLGRSIPFVGNRLGQLAVVVVVLVVVLLVVVVLGEDSDPIMLQMMYQIDGV